jgi:adenylosuccinate synthase
MLGRGKLNIIIDGQFGSTGKGLLSSYVGTKFRIDVAVTNGSPNAGHSFYVKNKKFIAHHLPVTGILNENAIIYLCSGAIINPVILLQELAEFKCSDRLYIHPRAAVIEKQDLDEEKEGSVKKIASTRSGVGSALVRKIKRSASLAKDNKILKPFVKEFDLNECLQKKEFVVMEVPQGFDLSINSGLSYPHCTSREITLSAALADAQVHPSDLGSVTVCIRTFPIRVGHIVEKDKVVGDSGPFYPDSTETSWANIGVEEEFTTVTGRVRRVATFSMIQYKRMLKAFRPDYILLNFTNYLSEKELAELLHKLPEVTHISNGPKVEDIKDIGTKLTIYDGNYVAYARCRMWKMNQENKSEKERKDTGTPG